jgi:hypothetical protein
MAIRIRRSVTTSAVLALALLAGGVAAPAAAQDLPSYARPTASDETIQGRIISVDGTFRISLQDVRGFVDQVQLNQSTIVNPLGLTLAPGMDVTITGSNAGDYFAAGEIDTAYAYDGDIPPPVYYGPGWWYPGFGYGYGPAYSLGIIGGPPFFIHRPFYGHAWRGAFRPFPYRGNGPRTLSVARGNTGAAGNVRRTFGGAGTPTRMDQVYSGGGAAHHAEPEVYNVAPAAHAAPAAHSSSGSSRH